EGAGVVDLKEGALTNIVSITFKDPIDTGTVPRMVKERVNDYSTNPETAPITVVSAREMHLILAEAALAQGDTGTFTTHINHVRAMDGLTPYEGQIPAMEMLQHSRKANLFLQGRRLADMYRFGTKAPMWQEGSSAASQPGTFFPITVVEIRSNPNLSR
ncbi:MAG: RagB/SusD family nutrient uptake outer membrane protein, partial [Gemmatimonadota bacterium]